MTTENLSFIKDKLVTKEKQTNQFGVPARLKRIPEATLTTPDIKRAGIVMT